MKTWSLQTSLPKFAGLLLMAALAGCGGEAAPASSSAAAPASGSAAASGAAAPASSAAAAAKPETPKFEIIGSRDPQTMSQPIIADTQGFFKAEGLDISLKLALFGTEVVPVLLSGANQVTVGAVNGSLTQLNANNNLPLRLVAPVNDSGDASAVIARKGSNINTPKDLEGKRLGLTIAGPIPFWIASGAKTYGFDISTVKMVNILPQDTPPAFDKGDLDAALCAEPCRSQLVSQGAKLLFTGRTSYLDPTPAPKNAWGSYQGLTFHKDFITKNPNTVKAVIRAMIKATDFINSNPDQAAKILAGPLQAPEDQIRTALKLTKYNMAFSKQFEQDVNDTNVFLSSNPKDKPALNKMLMIKDVTDTSFLKSIDPKLVPDDW